jgi:hypothetical protein
MKKLEELFDLPRSDELESEEHSLNIDETKIALAEIDDAIDKIDSALPMVRDLQASDVEMDDLAKKATESFDELMLLGMNVDSRFAAEIFSVAGAMLGHALTAKQAKLNKKLKMIDLQLKKANLDMKQADGGATAPQPGQGHVLDRNELLDRLLGDRKTNAKKG